MRAVAHWLPRAVPRILGEDRTAGLSAMDYLAPEDHRLWKTELLAGRAEPYFAAAVGRDIGIQPHYPVAVAVPYSQDFKIKMERLYQEDNHD